MAPLTHLSAHVHTLARHIRHLPDRVLHPLRRRRARRLATGIRGTVLVICHGNICRSPFAAELLRRRLSVITVESAGFIGPGRAPPASAREAAAGFGVNLEEHRSRVMESEAVRKAALAVVMDRQQQAQLARLYGPRLRIVLLGDFDPQPIRTRAVLDPIDRDLPFFHEVYTRIDRCTAAVAEAITSTADV